MNKKENEEEKEVVSEYTDVDVFEDSLLPSRYRNIFFLYYIFTFNNAGLYIYIFVMWKFFESYEVD